MREWKGGKVRGNEMFNIVCKCTQRRSDPQRGCKSAASRRWENGFGVYHARTMKTFFKPEENSCHSLQSRLVHWDDQSQYHQEIESVFVGGRLSFLLPPPAQEMKGTNS